MDLALRVGRGREIGLLVPHAERLGGDGSARALLGAEFGLRQFLHFFIIVVIVAFCFGLRADFKSLALFLAQLLDLEAQVVELLPLERGQVAQALDRMFVFEEIDDIGDL